MTDIYHTIEAPAAAVFKDKGSRFLAFAYSVSAVEQAEAQVAALRKEHRGARHVCFAYRLGAEGAVCRSYDDGEPAGTAGLPVMGQLLSFDLVNTLVAVVRYFGGTLLGRSGLINAYRTAAQMALSNAVRVERYWTERLTLTFDASQMNRVMQMVKNEGLRVVEQDFAERYRLIVEVRRSSAEAVRQMFIPCA